MCKNKPQPPHVRFIGDVHGLIERPRRKRSYKALIENVPYSVQLGDLGLEYGSMADVHPCRHRAIAGNHDDYTCFTQHFLGDYGVHAFPLETSRFEFFFVRGAKSVDRDSRTEGFDWWPEEELQESHAALVRTAYAAALPKIVLSHDCPLEVLPDFATNIMKLAQPHEPVAPKSVENSPARAVVLRPPSPIAAAAARRHGVPLPRRA